MIQGADRQGVSYLLVILRESMVIALLLIGIESVDGGRKRIAWNNVIRAAESFRKARSVNS